MLTETTIQNLQQIVKEDFGQELTLQETSELAYWLLDYIDLTANIIKQK